MNTFEIILLCTVPVLVVLLWGYGAAIGALVVLVGLKFLTSEAERRKN